MSSLTNKRTSVTRHDFIRSFVEHGGLTYAEAAKAFNAMVSVFGDAIVNGQKVNVGNVLSIKTVKRQPRRVNMGLNGTKRTIFLGSRIAFKVSVYGEFMRQHELDWKL